MQNIRRWITSPKNINCMLSGKSSQLMCSVVSVSRNKIPSSDLNSFCMVKGIPWMLRDARWVRQYVDKIMRLWLDPYVWEAFLMALRSPSLLLQHSALIGLLALWVEQLASCVSLHVLKDEASSCIWRFNLVWTITVNDAQSVVSHFPC